MEAFRPFLGTEDAQESENLTTVILAFSSHAVI